MAEEVESRVTHSGTADVTIMSARITGQGDFVGVGLDKRR
jgi:hypothetical protein